MSTPDSTTQPQLDFTTNADVTTQAPTPPPAAVVPPQETVVAPEPAPVVGDEEVAFTAGDEDLSGDTTPAPVEDEPDEVDELELIEPKVDHKEWVIGDPSLNLRYVQTPLSFIGKMQWFALVGDVIDRAMSGPSAISVNELLNSPNKPGQTLSMDDLREADTFVRAIGKLLIHAPDFLVESYCIWINVPKTEREIVTEIMNSPVSMGGIDDDMGMEIIERFIDQNYDELSDFFSVKVGALQKRVAAKTKARRDRSKK
jgi:hypothetical protein